MSLDACPASRATPPLACIACIVCSCAVQRQVGKPYDGQAPAVSTQQEDVCPLAVLEASSKSPPPRLDEADRIAQATLAEWCISSGVLSGAHGPWRPVAYGSYGYTTACGLGLRAGGEPEELELVKQLEASHGRACMPPFWYAVVAWLHTVHCVQRSWLL